MKVWKCIHRNLYRESSMAEEETEDQKIAQNDRIVMHNQMLSNTVQFGRIVEKGDGDPTIPEQGAFVLVHIGGEEKGSYTRNWMQWISNRSGYDATWCKPEIDEQVVVLAPSGNLKLGVVIGVIPRGDWLSFPEKNDFNAAPKAEQKIPDAKLEHQHLQVYKDGSRLSYDRQTHALEFLFKEKPEDEPGLDFSISLNGDNGQLTIKFGSGDEPKASVEMSTEKGFKFTMGENFIDFNGEDISFKSKKFIIDTEEISFKSKKYALDSSDGMQVKSKKFNFDDSVEIKAVSSKLTLDAGTKLEISSSGADVS